MLSIIHVMRVFNMLIGSRKARTFMLGSVGALADAMTLGPTEGNPEGIASYRDIECGLKVSFAFGSPHTVAVRLYDLGGNAVPLRDLPARLGL